MIVWNGKDIIGLYILGGMAAIAILLGVVYAIKRGIDKVVDKHRGEEHSNEEKS